MRLPLIALALFIAGFAARPVAAQSLATPWVNLGFGLAGTHGAPVFVPTGTLAAGSALDLSLTNCLSNQHAYLVIGTGILYAPYKGGILVPKFDLLFQFSTGNTGGVHLLSHWPPGVPPGTPFVMQFWVNDPGAPVGRAGSNAAGALTP